MRSKNGIAATALWQAKGVKPRELLVAQLFLKLSNSWC